jgi:PIN domain nuclease of toxin-antitoxin system
MTLLLDTHTLVWFAFDDPRVSPRARLLLEDRRNELLMSPASLWEMAIKIGIGKWQLETSYQELMDSLWIEYSVTLLPIVPKHTCMLVEMIQPQNHRDPFDRMLVAQALVEELPLVSVDEKLDQYGIERIW